MTKGAQFRSIAIAAVAAALLSAAGAANAATCGNTSAGFDSWKQQMLGEARAKGIGATGISALQGTTYSHATISADRGQHSFKLSLDQFLAKRGGPAIVSRGRVLKQQHAAMFASIEQRYGVPPGPLIAIWGMETAFGATRGNQNALSAVATLAYDCRRSAYFTEQLLAALTLVDRGVLNANSKGSMHGEHGHTQFLPKNILDYGTGGSLDVAANALASTANFLKGHGWRSGAGWSEGEPNFAAILEWNSAPIYAKTVALFADRLAGR
jgi:membrane-bound lytic murein transglycosylase B